VVAVCLLGVRAQTATGNFDGRSAHAAINVAETAITLAGSGFTSRLSAGLLNSSPSDAKQLDHLSWLDCLSPDPGKSNLLPPARRLPVHSAVALPTSGRSPPSLTL
jgi:hypothetical protein